MNLPFFIAKRYFFSRNNLSAINIITGISITAYAVGAFALISLLSALNGFETAIFKVYENYYPDLKIIPTKGKVFDVDAQMLQKLSHWQGIKTVSLTLEENAIISNGENQVVGLVKGVDSQYVSVVKTDSLLVAGEPIFTNKNGSFAWMAEGLFYKLNLGSDNKTVDVMAPGRESAGVSQMDIVEDAITVSAVLRPGDEMDQKLMISSLDFARNMFDRQDQASAIEVKLNSQADEYKVKNELKTWLGKAFHVRNRQEQNQAVYKMFNTEKWAAFSIMSFVMLLISFNLIGALSMLVLEKKTDRSILTAMGMTQYRIRNIFFSEGVLVAISGSILGILLGVAVVFLQSQFGFIQTNATFVSAYPVELRLRDVIMVLSLCVAMGVSVSIYPAWKSSSNQ